MSKVTISGFYDEVSKDLATQIQTLKELGEQYMCPRSVNGKNIASYTAEEFAKDIKPILDRDNIKFSSIGSPIGKISLDDDIAYEDQCKKLGELVKICQMMNCKYIRIFSFFPIKGVSVDSCFDKVVEKLKGFLKIVEGTDIVLLHENEKKIFGDEPQRCLKLYKEINNPQFSLCYDASNYIQVGQDPLKAYEMLKDYVIYYHIKDCSKYRVEVPVGMGEGHYDYLIKDILSRGYEGFMTLEPHTAKYSALKRLVYITPFFPLIMNNFYKAFRMIDKQYNMGRLEVADRKKVFLWQYENLKKLINEAK